MRLEGLYVVNAHLLEIFIFDVGPLFPPQHVPDLHFRIHKYTGVAPDLQVLQVGNH